MVLIKGEKYFAEICGSHNGLGGKMIVALQFNEVDFIDNYNREGYYIF